MGGNRIAAIDFFSDDPDNGIFAGNTAIAMYGEIEIEGPTFEGYAFPEIAKHDAIRVHRHTLLVEGRAWVGDWCWDRYLLPRDHMKRLLLRLRRNGWRIRSGPARFQNWWYGAPTCRSVVRHKMELLA